MCTVIMDEFDLNYDPTHTQAKLLPNPWTSYPGNQESIEVASL